MQSVVLDAVRSASIDDSVDFAKSNNFSHQAVVGVLKSLHSREIVEISQKRIESWQLTDEGSRCRDHGSPEYLLKEILETFGETPKKVVIEKFNALLPSSILPVDQTEGKIPKSAGEKMLDIAVSQGMKHKIFKIRNDGDVFISLTKPDFHDDVREACRKISSGIPLESTKAYEVLKKRQLVYQSITTSYAVKKGPKYDSSEREVAVDLTRSMLQNRTWKNMEFKPYNLNAAGALQPTGSIHPLMRVKQEYREIFLEMGFTEMETSNYIESSFWNFDALFVPQNHPARDAQDTFFISDPKSSAPPVDTYLNKVKSVHESGEGCESTGYSYVWSGEEAKRNVLRTHTTAVTARILYQLAQNRDHQYGKFFSIDRVFRNEEMDKTHLCEFHQIEGVIIDKDLSLVHMMTVLKQFFQRIGIQKLRFKPAYNPYTEPSMEIFGYHEGHKNWIEVGNSGMFRPEMLRPMGFPSGSHAIAWGLSLERPTMIKYGLKNIHDLFGHKIDVSFCKRSPIYRV